ncbi:hypothetical protein GOODEAATRI_020743, partial [Goodea atripinnis]
DETGQSHQVWYDDPQSLRPKADYVMATGLRGIGMWNGNILDYSDDPCNKLQRPLIPRLPCTVLQLCSPDEAWSFIWGGATVLFIFFILMFLLQPSGRNRLLGTLGDVGEFNGLLCPCFHAEYLGWVEIDLLLWGAAAGIRGEGLGAETAVCLQCGQQVQLWLGRLPASDNISFKGTDGVI